MKKLLAIALLTTTLSANAFWNNGNVPWGNGYQNNNGFIGYNPFSRFSPNWFTEEMNDFADEFRNNNSWGNNNRYNNGYNQYRPYNTWNRGNAPRNNTPWGNNNRHNAPVRYAR